MATSDCVNSMDQFAATLASSYQSAQKKLRRYGDAAPLHLTEKESFAVCMMGGAEVTEDCGKMTVRGATVSVVRGEFRVQQKKG